VTICDDVVLFVSLGRGVLHDPLMLDGWWDTLDEWIC
jgi:hypothetical protein